MTASRAYDYIVVGGGTAGCVLAARLSARGDRSVLLLEAGGRQPLDLMGVPGAWPALLGGGADWSDTSVVQAFTGSTIPLSRGRCLGGSSSINGMNFLRGDRASYDAWPAQGAAGWGFDDLLPYFCRSETAVGRDSAARGSKGMLSVSPPTELNPVVEAGLRAAVEVGFHLVDDVSSGEEAGFGVCDNNIVNGVRQSAADAYLRPVLDRPNLDLVTDVLVDRVLLDGDKCVGVAYTKDGKEPAAGRPGTADAPGGGDVCERAPSAFCGKEVILSAGAIGSPAVLLRSGIGPGKLLVEQGVDPVHELSGVGENLQDHPVSTVTYRAGRLMPHLEQNPPGEAMGLVRALLPSGAPDLQVLFVSLPLHAPDLSGPDNGYTIAFSAMTPRSRGSVRLADADPRTPLLVDPDYLDDAHDVYVMGEGLRIARRIGAAEALDEWRAEEVLPGPAVGDDDAEAVRGYLRESLTPYFHYAGTCRIGTDEGAVVGPDLRVHGVQGLRVVDASVMPSLPSANTNATVYAIAERAAELIG